jgi:hypothetical protein
LIRIDRAIELNERTVNNNLGIPAYLNNGVDSETDEIKRAFGGI